MKRVLIIISSVMLLAGCGVSGLYSEYERPGVEFVDSLYRRLPSQYTDSSSIASLDWTEFFSDPVLQDWIRLGIEHNTDLSVARLKVEQAQATLQAARSAFFPSATLNMNAGAGYPGGVNYGISPSASWEADIFGKLTNAKRQAAAAVQQSQAYRQAVESQLVATIAESYYRLLMLDEQLAISERTLETWEENIKTLEALKRAGKTNEAAVLQAKANRLNVESSTYSLHLQIFEAENAFAALIGIVPSDIERGKLEGQSFPHSFTGGIPAEILGNRPDVRQAEMDLAQAFYATNIARSAFYPSVKLTGSMAFNPAGFIADLTAALMQPLYAKGVNKAALRKAEAAREIAAHEFRQSLLDAGVEVNNALIALETASAKMKIDQKQILNLQAAVWNTQLLMKHGNANYLEVLSAQKNLLSSELSEVSDRYDEIRSIINLYHALGGGYSRSE